jgi:hypothetical protein
MLKRSENQKKPTALRQAGGADVAHGAFRHRGGGHHGRGVALMIWVVPGIVGRLVASWTSDVFDTARPTMFVRGCFRRFCSYPIGMRTSIADGFS